MPSLHQLTCRHTYVLYTRLRLSPYYLLPTSLSGLPLSAAMAAVAEKTDPNVHPKTLTFKREANLPPSAETTAPPHQHRKLDSHSLYWDDLNKPKFLSLITGFYLGLRPCVYPATVVKTRQQAHVPLPGVAAGDATMKASIVNVFRQTWKVGGPRAVYQAFTWNIIGLPVDPLYIGSMEYSRQWLHQWLERNEGSVPKKWEDLFVTLTAGGAAAVVQQTLMVPIDVVTQRLMIQPTIPKEHLAAMKANKSAAAASSTTSAASSSSSAATAAHGQHKPHMTPIQVINDIMKNDGLRGLYKGYALTLACVVPFSALQWALYWQVQSFFQSYLRSHSAPATTNRPVPTQPGEEEYSSDWREMATAPVSAAVAATLASLATQPFDTLKTRLQVGAKRMPLSEVWSGLVKEKGVAGLMSGSLARVLTVMPSAVLSMSAYEMFKRMSVKDEVSGMVGAS